MRASTTDYSRQDKSKDWVVLSYDGFLAYLLIVDEASHYVWIFLTNSKSPPLDIIEEFLTLHGHAEGECIRTDQGGKLAGTSKFQDILLRQSTTLLNPLGLIVLPKTVRPKSTMTNSPSAPAPCCMVLPSPPSTGPRRSYIRSTSTILWSTARHE
jgi:hypothetical protein